MQDARSSEREQMRTALVYGPLLVPLVGLGGRPQGHRVVTTGRAPPLRRAVAHASLLALVAAE